MACNLMRADPRHLDGVQPRAVGWLGCGLADHFLMHRRIVHGCIGVELYTKLLGSDCPEGSNRAPASPFLAARSPYLAAVGT